MKEQASGEVVIGFEPFNRRAFLAFLAFLYTGNCKFVRGEQFAVLFEASQFYQVC